MRTNLNQSIAVVLKTRRVPNSCPQRAIVKTSIKSGSSDYICTTSRTFFFWF